jgi:pantetheine-phosphate adenylyltransferase
MPSICLALTPLAEALAAQFAQAVPTRYLASPAVLGEVAQRWCERQRHWHGPDHALSMLRESAAAIDAGEDRDALLLAAVYHDVIYNPRASDNEEASADLLARHAADPAAPVIRQALEIIADSKWARLPETPLGRLFFDLDTRQLSDDCPLSERLAYERAIFREYQWAPWREYREKRAAFLRGWAERFPQHRRGAAECIELLTALQPRVAVYPGSFHPFHLGHLSILQQAERAFDKVIVALGVNRQKLSAADSLRQRQEALQAQLPFHETAAFDGLLSGFLDDLEIPATVVRGVRDGTDLEAELRYARFLNELRPGTGVVWISCEPQFQHLSSSAIRELAAIQPGAEQRYLPHVSTIYGLVGEAAAAPSVA